MMRIAIVNDLNAAIDSLRRTILERKGYEIAWTARSGAEAVRKCALDTPDLILMDLFLPEMDGVEATRRIMQQTPCPILVVNEALDGNTAKVFEAMGHGALDAVNTPNQENDTAGQKSRDTLLKKIDTIAKLGGKHCVIPNPLPDHRPGTGNVPFLIAMGASTGGPKALAKVLSSFPAAFNAVIVVVQHVDGEFSSGLVDWLDAQTPFKVLLAREGQKPRLGTAYLAGTNDHLIFTPDLAFSYTSVPLTAHFRPSINVFFQSVAKYWPKKCVAVLLTGMGRDGAEGLAILRRAGWYTIGQDEATSVVYGMPRAAKELGAAVDVLPIDRVAPAILDFLRKSRSN